MAFGESAFIMGASLTAINVAFIVITAVAARTIGLGVAEINILGGPTLISFHFGGTKIAVKSLPIGSGLTFREHGATREDRNSASEPARYLEDLNSWQRILLALSAPIGFFLIALPLVGSSIGHHNATALPDIYLGAIKPTTTGVELLQRYVDAWHLAPLMALGILAAKYSVYLLVPTAGSPGFIATATLLKSAFGYEPPGDFNLLVAIPLFLPPLIVLGGWSLATFFFLYPLLDAAV